MTKKSIREQDPERYAKVKAEQEELKRQWRMRSASIIPM